MKTRLWPSSLAQKHALYDALQAPQRALFSLNHLDNSGGLAGLTEDLSNPLASLTLGFYKKKKILIYYGLKGEFPYLPGNQIFSLRLSDIPFKASSFAKPFGGRFGPPPEHSDPLIPLHHYPGEPSPRVPIPNLNSALLQPNYSRWPGDRWGLIKWELHDSYSFPSLSFLNKRSYHNQKRIYNMGAFFNLIFYTDAEDPLARPGTGNLERTFMRMMELMAVYPDLYDLSFYSISGNYMKTYFPRICRLLKNGSDCSAVLGGSRDNQFQSNPKAYIRGDLGWPETDYYIGRNQGRKQTDLSIAPYFLKRDTGVFSSVDESEISLPDPLPIDAGKPSPPMIGPPPALTGGRIYYPWLTKDLPSHLLSSWSPTREENRYDSYVFPRKGNEGDFLSCEWPSSVALRDRPVPSSCAAGGRSGYSVKLLSCESMREIYDNTDTEKPSNLNEYCPP